MTIGSRTPSPGAAGNPQRQPGLAGSMTQRSTAPAWTVPDSAHLTYSWREAASAAGNWAVVLHPKAGQRQADFRYAVATEAPSADDDGLPCRLYRDVPMRWRLRPGQRLYLRPILTKARLSVEMEPA